MLTRSECLLKYKYARIVRHTHNLLCWHCCHPFDTIPIPLPIQYTERGDKWTYVGNFCSWGCAKAYNTDSGHVRVGERGMLLSRLKFRVFGKYIPTIPSPPRQCLRAFGGTMTIEEFRDKSPLGIIVSSLPKNMVPLDHIITTRKIDFESHSQKKQKHKDIDFTTTRQDVPKKNDNLRLKRNKPLPKAPKNTATGLECFLVNP